MIPDSVTPEEGVSSDSVPDPNVVHQSNPRWKSLAREFMREGRPTFIVFQGYKWTWHEQGGELVFRRHPAPGLDEAYGKSSFA